MDLTPGLTASALVHAAAFGAIMTWPAAAPPPAPSQGVVLAMVFAPASPAPAATEAVEPMPLPAPTPPPEAAPTPPSPPVATTPAPPPAAKPLRRPTPPVQAEIRKPPPAAAPPRPAAAPGHGDGAPVAAAAVALPPAPATPPAALSADYVTSVMAWLERHKRYPDAARARRDEGTVQIGFAIDRGGHVLSFAIRHSSGNAVLDAAAADLIQRADPLPPPPEGQGASRIEMVMPLTFSLR